MSDATVAARDLGSTNDGASYFIDGIARGASLLTVTGAARASEAVAILQANGADLGPGHIGGDQVIALRAERLSIDKFRVARGTARIHTAVVTRREDIDIAVWHEELVIERHRLTDRTVSGTIGDEKTITISLAHEDVLIHKEIFITEEVEIGKRAVTRVERVSETVRHEELVIDEPDRLAFRDDMRG